jgi:hypothetical protein
MGQHFVALVTRGVSRSEMCGAVFAAIAALATFVWFVAIAPALISFSLAVAAAVAWCICLEGNRGPGSEHSSWKSWGSLAASTAELRKNESRSS